MNDDLRADVVAVLGEARDAIRELRERADRVEAETRTIGMRLRDACAQAAALREALTWLLQDACSDKGRECLHSSHKRAFEVLSSSDAGRGWAKETEPFQALREVRGDATDRELAERIWEIQGHLRGVERWVSPEELEASMRSCAETLRQEWRDKGWVSPETFERVVQAARKFAQNETDSDSYVAELEHAMRAAKEEKP